MAPDRDGVGRNGDEGGEGDECGEALHFQWLSRGCVLAGDRARRRCSSMTTSPFLYTARTYVRYRACTMCMCVRGAALTELDGGMGRGEGLAAVVNADSPQNRTQNRDKRCCQQRVGASSTIQLEICR